MRDADHELPVARLEPRDAADRMVIVRAAAMRRGGQVVRFAVVVGKVAIVAGLMGFVAMLGGSSLGRSTRTSHRDFKPDLKMPKFELEHHLDHALILNELAKNPYEPPRLQDLDGYDEVQKALKSMKPVKHVKAQEKPAGVKRQPRP